MSEPRVPSFMYNVYKVTGEPFSFRVGLKLTVIDVVVADTNAGRGGGSAFLMLSAVI